MNLSVFCGSGTGNLPAFKAAAQEFGRLIGSGGHQLTYGGADIGLMGILADAVLANGGHVTGIIPSFLFEKEIAHRGISELIVVDSMHERKLRMAEHADGFVALPGGWGTLDELAEILTWKQLHLIQAPVGLLNIEGFYDPLLETMRKMCTHGFLKPENFDQLLVATTPEELMKKLLV